MDLVASVHPPARPSVHQCSHRQRFKQESANGWKKHIHTVTVPHLCQNKNKPALYFLEALSVLASKPTQKVLFSRQRYGGVTECV